MNVRLVEPTIEMEQEYYDYIGEWEKAGEDMTPFSVSLLGRDYKTWLEDTVLIKKSETCPSNLVPADTYFLVNELGKIIGAINIRHILNDFLFNCGGNIGYGIRPSERSKGYASKMLKLGLQKCIDLNIRKVLIVCDKDNLASAKTIISNGGVLENEVLHEGKIVQRYWIEL